MKKRLIVILSLIISLFICAFTLSGCDLVTTNTERDMNQVVATVNIGGEYKGKTEEILKKDMIIAYMQYGYYYAQQGSYTNSELFGTIIDNLINERILVQEAKVAVSNSENLTIKDWDKAENFITDDDDKLEAKYNAVSSIKSLIKSYIESVEELQDTLDETERTVPTDATNYSETFDDIENKEQAIQDIIDGLKGETGSDQMVAYNKTVKLLEVNELLGDNFKDNDIMTSYYYEYMLEAQFESQLISKYEQLLLENKVEKDLNNLDYDALVANYIDLYASQETLYENDIQSFKTALGSATKTAPIVYASEDAQKTVGYVWNLLIGVTDEQSEEISAVDSTNKTNDEVQAEKEAIYEDEIVMKDQRSSWITSGYDFIYDEDNETVRFVNDYTYLGDNGLPFQGKVEWINKGEYTQEYRTTEDGKYIIEYKLNGVVDEDYEPEFRVTEVFEVVGKDDIKSKIGELYNSLGANNDAINELLMAFSTDSGSLNSFKGYVVLKDDASSSWVTNFQEVGEKLVDNNNIGEMQIAPTDYGYHFMFFNGLVENYATLEDYCKAVDGEDKAGKDYYDYLIANWNNLTEEDKDTYLYYLINTYVENIVSNYETESERITRMDSSKVTKYEDRYSDLVEEDEE